MAETNDTIIEQASPEEAPKKKKKEPKPKNARTALLLALFFGELGFDRFYLGFWGLGILKLLTAGGLGIWWLIDIVKIMSLQQKDKKGRPLSLK